MDISIPEPVDRPARKQKRLLQVPPEIPGDMKQKDANKEECFVFWIFWIFSLDLFIQSVTTLRSMEGFSFEFYLLILALMSVSNLNPYVFLFAFTEHCQLSHTDNPSLSRVCCTLENLH